MWVKSSLQHLTKIRICFSRMRKSFSGIWGSKYLVDVFISWTFPMDWELNLIHVMSQYFFPGSQLRDSPLTNNLVRRVSN